MARCPRASPRRASASSRPISHGFYRLHENGAGQLVVTDLRMGLEPHYSFAFAVARRGSPFQPLPVAQSVGGIAPIGPALAWLGQRIRGDAVDPPR